MGQEDQFSRVAWTEWKISQAFKVSVFRVVSPGGWCSLGLHVSSSMHRGRVGRPLPSHGEPNRSPVFTPSPARMFRAVLAIREDRFRKIAGDRVLALLVLMIRCQVCKDHFLEMYNSCENERCEIPKTKSGDERYKNQGEMLLALWVWRAHNAVNVRLAEEAAEEGGEAEVNTRQ